MGVPRCLHLRAQIHTHLHAATRPCYTGHSQHTEGAHEFVLSRRGGHEEYILSETIFLHVPTHTTATL